jgi:hypothetical protein
MTPLHRRVEELSGVALGVTEDVTRQILGVRSHEHRYLWIDLAFDQHHVLAVLDRRSIDVRSELAAVSRGQPRGRDARDERLGL